MPINYVSIHSEIHHSKVAVLFVEPQWGSSAIGQPWPPAHLKWVVEKSKSYGIKVRKIGKRADFVVCKSH